ncbi:MAG: hypothetical protein GEU97_12130 [Actinophytocola sp.]|nr:hypothetical protein [Actinophytocola sp.]
MRVTAAAARVRSCTTCPDVRRRTGQRHRQSGGTDAAGLPFGTDAAGLPIGIHALGRYADEATLFRLAAQIEAATAGQRARSRTTAATTDPTMAPP